MEAFRRKFGLTDNAAMARFEEAVKIQQDTRFLQFGRGGGTGEESVRHLGDLKDAVTLLNRAVTAPPDVNVNIDRMRITGTLRIEGDRGTMEAEGSQEHEGADHVPNRAK
jgi:predicted DNA-binding WGR domain protein